MPCFEALHSLLSVRKLERLAEAAILLPSAEQLLQVDNTLEARHFFSAGLLEYVYQVESKYGESVSLEDMDGRQSVKKPRDRRGSKQTKMDADAPVTQNAGDSAGAAIPTAAADVPARRKAATDSRNDAFEAARLAHRPPDFLGREREVLEEALEGLASRRADVAAERAADPVPAKFCYSGQMLHFRLPSLLDHQSSIYPPSVSGSLALMSAPVASPHPLARLQMYLSSFCLFLLQVRSCSTLS